MIFLFCCVGELNYFLCSGRIIVFWFSRQRRDEEKKKRLSTGYSEFGRMLLLGVVAVVVVTELCE